MQARANRKRTAGRFRAETAEPAAIRKNRAKPNRILCIPLVPVDDYFFRLTNVIQFTS
jgi:hypothetical protein